MTGLRAFIAVQDGEFLICCSDDVPIDQADKVKPSVEALKVYFAEHPEVTGYICSSSVDFGHEYGVPNAVDLLRAVHEEQH